MADVHAAIAGYAVRHRTPGLRYVVETQITDASGNRRSDTRSYWIPANRPYLPCPDYNSDGIENRVDPMAVIMSQLINGHVVDVKPVTLNPAATYPLLQEMQNEKDFTTANAGVRMRSLAEYGVCAHHPGHTSDSSNSHNANDRGVLPWRTLGVLPTDRWGGRFTYRADTVYASALTGFGHDTSIDSYDPRVPMHYLQNGGNLRLMSLRRPSVSNGAAVNDTLTPKSMVPSMVCSEPDYNDGGGERLHVCDPVRPNSTGLITRINSSISSSNTQPEHELLVGSVATAQVGHTQENIRPIPFPLDLLTASNLPGHTSAVQVGGVVEGLPYVVLSHGPNQHFAVKHREAADAFETLSSSTSQWNPCLVGRDSVRSNGRLNTDASIFEAHNSPCPVIYASGANRQYPTYLFVKKLGPSWDDDFDDIIEWRTRSQLLADLSEAGVLPAAGLPLLLVR